MKYRHPSDCEKKKERKEKERKRRGGILIPPLGQIRESTASSWPHPIIVSRGGNNARIDSSYGTHEAALLAHGQDTPTQSNVESVHTHRSSVHVHHDERE